MKRFYSLIIISFIVSCCAVTTDAQFIWTQRANCSATGRLCPVGVNINGKGYIGTGWNGTVNLTDMWEYDPTLNTWTQKANFPGTPRYGAAGFTVGNFGYVGLGCDAIYPAYTFPLDFWKFDPIANSWSPIANFPGSGRYTISTFSIGAYGYLGTGWSGAYYSDFWRYDPATDSWLQLANFGGGIRQSAVGFAIGNKGYISTGNHGVNYNDLWEYDPVGNSWTQRANYPGAARYGASCFVLGSLGFVGTGDGAIEYTDMWAYSPATNNWTAEPAYTGAPLYHAIGFSIGCKGYIGTGWTTSFYSPVKTFYELSPVVNSQFAANPLSTCTGTPITFTNQSTGADTYFWTFGDGDTSTATNPAHTYLSFGSFTVTLISSFYGCAYDTTTTVVNIQDIAVAGFLSPPTVCEFQQVAFQNTSTGTGNYIWDFGDGSQMDTSTNPVHGYSSSGTFTVTLIANSGNCSDTTFQTISITSGAQATFNYSGSQCFGSIISFINTSLNASGYYWDFGDGDTSSVQSPTHTFTSTGTFTISLIAISGICSDTISQNITINNQPLAAFSYSSPTCSGSAVIFNNSSTSATTYHWNFGDGDSSLVQTPTHIYSSSGSYTVTLIASAGNCTDTISQNITISTTPISAFSFAGPTCIGQTISFTNSSSSASIYHWNFGGGDTSNIQAPNHIYTSNGIFTITLVAISGLCSDTISQNITINSLPLAAFTYTGSPCTGSTLVFNNNSTGAITYHWLFGDGDSSLIQTPNHIYISAGNYTVTLIANSGNCTDTVSQNILISTTPIAAFSSSGSVCLGQTIQFTNSSSGAVVYHWAFGDGDTSNLQTPNHIYTSAGIFAITLIASSGLCSDTMTQNVTITTQPIAAFTYSGSLCTGSTLVFNNSSTGATSYRWYFGDGDSSLIQTPSHIYSYSGTFTVTLIASSGNCIDTITQSVQITTSPLAVFAYAGPTCIGEVLSFNNSTSSGLSYHWNFGDGDTSNLQAPNHVYTSTGTFTVTLIAYAGACSDTTSQNVTIANLPVTAFSFSGLPCLGSTIFFTNTSTGGQSYYWNFGDGDTSNVQTPNHVYNSYGTFVVRLIVYSPSCGTDTTQQNITIYNSGTALFSFSIDSCLSNVVFNNLSTGGTSFTWDFGDGNSSTETSPNHQYGASGESHVTLIANPGTVCSDTMSLTIQHDFDVLHSLFIPNCFSPNADAYNEYFSIRLFSACTDYHLMIFNRWGEKLFESSDLSKPWDGKYKNTIVPPGVYEYILTEGNTNRTLAGFVTVLK